MGRLAIIKSHKTYFILNKIRNSYVRINDLNVSKVDDLIKIQNHSSWMLYMVLGFKATNM